MSIEMTSKNPAIDRSSRKLPGSPSQPSSGVNDYLIDAHEWILPTTATNNPDAKIALSSPDSAGCVEIIQISCRLDPPLTDAEAGAEISTRHAWAKRGKSGYNLKCNAADIEVYKGTGESNDRQV